MTMYLRTAVVLLLALAAALPAALAQTAAKVPRVGVLLFGTPETDPNVHSFRAGLGDLGYVEGRNIALEFHYAEGKPERLADLARDLVRTRPDVIFALGGDVAPFVRTATSTIPIVVAVSLDPVQSGLVANLARPGGNLTGVTFVSSDLAAKRLQLLKNPDHVDPEYRETQAAGRTLGVQVHSLEVRAGGDLERAFQTASAARVEAIVVVSSRLMAVNRQAIADLATRNRMLLVAGWGGWPQVGALFSYGPDLDVIVRLAATHVDKVLRGARPGDIPIEQPNKFDLIVNLKAARAHGLTVPPAILGRADRVLE
jgi:putative ABC transport system substrate-binding protein